MLALPGVQARDRVRESRAAVASEIHRRLFDPFAIAGEDGGIGAGLVFGRETVRDQGGEMWIDSISKGARLAPSTGRSLPGARCYNSLTPRSELESHSSAQKGRLSEMKVFGSFRLDTVNHCIWRGDERVPLTPKAFDVLRYLIEHADRLVTQDELLEALWPETYVNPEGIRKYILEIRKVLEDPATKPVYIQTFPKRGYQFIAPITTGRSDRSGRAMARTAEAIVGRQAEFQELGRYLENALNGQRQIVFVTGEAGIGKTTLVDAFQQQTISDGDVRIARGQCIEGFGGIEAYYPVLEAMGSLLQDARNSALRQLLAERAPTWLVQFPALVTSDVRESLQRAILGSTRDRMVREICEALEIFTAQTPLILILEDLHWVDHSTLDLISALARRRDAAKLLLIATYRPVDVVLSQSPLKALKQDLLVRRLCHEMQMESLEEPHVSEYLSTVFDRDSIPPGFPGVIHQSSGGNPLFMVAIVEEMRVKGLIEDDGGRLLLTASFQPAYSGIPETLQQMLDIQFERLSPEERRLLESASIAGERFSVWAAAAILNAPEATIEQQCDQIERRHGFIRGLGVLKAPDGTPSAFYEFRHSLYRQSLTRSLSGLNRSQLHHRLAARLMPCYNAGKHELASELALHLEQGGDHEQATRCLISAAENATSRFSHRSSIEILRHAIEVCAELTDKTAAELRILILQRIGDTQYALGEISNSAASFEAAAHLASKAGLRSDYVRALIHAAIPLWHLDAERGDQTCRRALALSRELNDPLLTAHIQLAAASLRLIYDRWREEDAERCAEAEQTIRRLGAFDVLSDVFHVYVKGVQGQYEDALKEAEQLIDTSTSPIACMQAAGAKGFIELIAGQFGSVLRTIRTEQHVAGRNEADAWMWICGESWLRALCWDFDGVRRLSGISMRSDADLHAWWTTTVGRVNAGYGELVQGHFTEALRYFDQVRDFGVTPRFFLHWHWRMQADMGAAETRLAAGNMEDARREADNFLASALSVPDPNMRVLAWKVKARVCRALQDLDGASECIRNAFRILDTRELPLVAWLVHRTAWDLCRDMKEFVKAEEHRARAQDLFMQVANSFDEKEPLRASLLAAPPARRLFEQAASA